MDEERKQPVFVDLKKYHNKLVTVKLISGQHITGILSNYDKIPNIVLEKKDDWEYGNKIICLGHSILSIALGEPIYQ